MSTMPITAASTRPASSLWRRYARRGVYLCFALLLLLLVAFFLLPVWISNEQGRLYVLDRLNERLHGPKMVVDKWSLGWFRKTQLTNLRIIQPDGTTLLSCPHVSSGLTLWDIFWGRYDIGNTTADELELRIARRADGSTSLDSLATGAGAVLRSARGAVQINRGRLTLVSERTGQTARYVDVKAVINVASSDAPFHVQLAAVGAAAGGGESSISLRGTFPPTRTLSAQSLQHPGVWEMLTDVDLTANRVPTELACDLLGVDGRWVDSIGEVLEAVQFSGHAIPAQRNIRLALVMRGSAGGGDVPWVDARVLLHEPGKDGRGAMLSLPAGDYHAGAGMRYSVALGNLLGRVNPLLEEATAGPAGGLVKGTVSSLRVPLDDAAYSQAAARVTFPQLEFAARNGPSLVRQLEVLTGDLPRPVTTAPAGIAGTAEVLQVRMGDGEFAYENFRITLGKNRVTFSGAVNLDGRVDLVAVVPEARAGLAAGSTRVVIRGTVDSPVMQRSE